MDDSMNAVIKDEQFSAIDRHFARFMMKCSDSSDDGLMLAALLVSSRTSQGDICLDIPAAAGKPIAKAFGETENRFQLPVKHTWIAQLRTSQVVGFPGEFKPLILDEQGRLYLYRYWEYEQSLAASIKTRLALNTAQPPAKLLRQQLDRLFPRSADAGTDWQRVAACAAVQKKICVLSGGPGTGKTYAAARILALLLEQERGAGRAPAVALAAPTGKAAARLKEIMQQAKRTLDCSDEIKAALPEEAFTMHRLLGPVPGTPYFRYTAENQLPYDIVVVDESSMADLALMAKLFQAVPGHAHLILLGDRDQLASVAAGAVLGDICDTGNEHGYSRGFARIILECGGEEVPSAKSVQPMADSLIVLHKNYRFGADSGIGELSQAIRSGNAERALHLLKNGGNEDIVFKDSISAGALESALEEPAVRGYTPYLNAQSPDEALNLITGFKVLCALRQGPYGVESINRIIETILKKEGFINPSGRWYQFRPVMVTRNDYTMNLFNGDVGIAWQEAASNYGHRVFFSARDGGLRSVLPVKLPEHETVYAMTVHKSQGSEFDRVLIILPDRESPVLTRELLYTAISRARNRAEIWGPEKILRFMINNPTSRTSGLRDALWS
jgi:exodeoxyribonuclease V alpha subunit